MLGEKVMMIFPRSPILNVIEDSTKGPTSSDYIYETIARQDLKFGPEVEHDVVSNGFFIVFETLQKKIHSENATMTCLE